ncbi:HK97 family phage prohead protease [Streptomyces sp. NPDC050422]|uniref:HK97 family phage prohead protease n=1 Tax=Streptomyces sp. NPDC050422 TaxID=3365614 RepID=UPI00379473FB
MESRALVRALSARSAGSARTIRGYGIVFHALSARMGSPAFVEQISPTAWNPAADPYDVIATFGHDEKQFLGRRSANTLRLGTDATGIWYEVDLPNTTAGNDLFELVKRGDVTGSSFTFRVDDDEWHKAADGTPLRTVTRMRVFELGPVLNPAYPDTTVAARSMRAASSVSTPLQKENIMTELSLNPILADHAKRSLVDVRLLGNSLTEMREADFVPSEDARPVPVVLNASGRGSRLIERVTTYPFSRQFGYVPITPKVTAEIQPRNAAQAALAARVSTIGTAALKVSALVSIDNDELVDVPSSEGALNTALAAAVGQRVDDVLINGGDDGDTVAPGILDKGTRTAALAKIGYDELADAVARIETSGGITDAVIGDPIAIAALRKALPGDKLSTLPEFVSLPPLADGTPILAVDTVIVADLASCGVGMRSRLEVAKTTEAPEAHESDSAFIAGRARIGSIVLADAARVQVLTTQAA